jgi:hypothetical protein
MIVVYFRRLKINHDSHEFILESGTIANKAKNPQTNVGLNFMDLAVNRFKAKPYHVSG